MEPTLIVSERAPNAESVDASVESGSTHKARTDWFQARESWPWREAPMDQLTSERARAESTLPRVDGADQWRPVGPTIGGRMTCAVCDPNDADRLWAGAAGGGVWFSSDAGSAWQALWHDQPSLNVGALALDPHDSDVIYCATGEANLSADSHPGVGMFRSLDAGQNWQLLAAAESAGLPRRMGAIAIDPFDANHLLAGGVAHRPGDATGLFVSTDGGVTWAMVPIIGGAAYRCHDVRFHPDTTGRIYVTISALGTMTGVWRSTDGGVTWQHLQDDLPPPDQILRTSLALAPSDPEVIYAQMGTPGRPSGVLGIFRSGDGGDTWTSIAGQHFGDERQMSYNNTIVVHPEDPDHVICGGVDLHLTTNGGAHWDQVTKWDAVRGNPDYAHADHHALLMPAASPGRVYDLNDGGMDFSADGGRTWQNRSNGLATNMFYDLAVAQSNADVIAGGAQDNGTLITGDASQDGWFELTGGDGGWIVIDPSDVNHLFSTAQGMRMWRFRSSDGWAFVPPPELEHIRSGIWMMFVAMDAHDPKRLFTGSVRVWRTTDDGDTWQAVSETLDGSPVTAIEVARADPQRVYVGTEKGGFFRSVDAGTTWSGNIASTVLPALTITRVESRADDADTVYATVANFGNHHVFRSDDGGLHWVDIDRGELPDAPFHSLAAPAAHPTRVYACSDVGVFVSEDQGDSWANLTGNLPTVMVVDLVYHEATGMLAAATYGRSVWRLQVD